MNTLEFVVYVSIGLVSMALVPVAYVLLREYRFRLRDKREKDREEAAFLLLGTMRPPDLLTSLPPRPGARPTEFALQGKFDAATIERAMVRVLRRHAGEKLYVDLFNKLGYTKHYLEAVVESSSWSERAHAAEVLGLLGAAEACEPLVAALRDEFEDVTVKRAAADALGRIRTKAVLPKLVNELRLGDDAAAPIIADALVPFGEVAVKSLVSVLERDPQPGARMWTARILGRIASTAAVTPLTGQLDDPDARVRVSIAEALGSIGDGLAVSGLLEVVQSDPAASVRQAAVRALGQLGDERVVHTLVGSLTDGDFGTRIRALEALEMLRPRDTGPVERLLRDSNPEVRRRAAIVLARGGYLDARVDELVTEGAVRVAAEESILELARAGLSESIARYGRDSRPKVREAMVRICGQLGEGRLSSVLEEGAVDSHPQVRVAAAQALALTGIAEHEEILFALLCDDAVAVAAGAAAALIARPQCAVDGSFDDLVHAYNRGGAGLRASVVQLVARSQDERVEELASRAATDTSAEVRRAALQHLATRFLLGELLERLSDSSAEVRSAAIEALAATGRPGARDALIRLLPGASYEMREKIAEALASHGLAWLREGLESLGEEAGVEVQLGLAWALGKTADRGAVGYLTRMLVAPNARLRASAAGALGKIHGESSMKALLDATSDPDPRTRAAAVNAVGMMDGVADESAAAVLKRRLSDPDEFVRNRAAIALASRDADALSTLREAESWVQEAPLTIALALLGSAPALALASAQMADPKLRAAVLAYLARDKETVRARFLSQLGLAGAGQESGDGGGPLDERTLLDGAANTLRTAADPAARQRAVGILSGIGTARSVVALADAVSADPSEVVRLSAVQALAPHAVVEAARHALEGAIRDPSVEVSSMAIVGLGKAGQEASSLPLLERLKSARPPLDDAAEAALAVIHEAAPERLLAQLRASEDEALVAAGLRVVGRIGGDDAVPVLLDYMLSDVVPIAAAAVRSVASLAYAQVAHHVEGSLHDRRDEIRLAAVESIVRHSDEVGLVALAPVAADPSEMIRARLARLIGRLGGEVVSGIFDRLLLDPEAAVRATALVSLLECGKDETFMRFAERWPKASLEVRLCTQRDPRIADLSRALSKVLSSHRLPRVRAATVVGVLALGAPEGVRELLFALSDPSPEVRISAVRALADSEVPAIRERLRKMVTDDQDDEVRDAVKRARLRVVS